MLVEGVRSVIESLLIHRVLRVQMIRSMRLIAARLSKTCHLRLLPLILLCFVCRIPSSAAPVMRIAADLDHDGTTEIIEIGSYGDSALQIRHGRTLLWQGIPAAWRPWKLAVADVDGDGRSEIVVGIVKATKFFPKPHNCLFIYGWDGRRVFPKWLGSTLSRPFTDFLFTSGGGPSGDGLLSLETSLEGRKSLAAYRWNGFGFTLDWRKGEWQNAAFNKDISGTTSVEADGELIPIDGKKARKNNDATQPKGPIYIQLSDPNFLIGGNDSLWPDSERQAVQGFAFTDGGN